MADLLSLLPGIRQLPSIFGGGLTGGGGAGRDFDPTMMQDTFGGPDRTTIAGLPIAPLVTGGLGALLFNRLAKKGYGRQAALQGGLLGYNLMNAPIQHEQQQQDAVMRQLIQQGYLEPYQAPSPQPTANQMQFTPTDRGERANQVPLLPAPWNDQMQFTPTDRGDLAGNVPATAPPAATTPAGARPIRYGGASFQVTPTVTYGDLDPTAPPGLRDARFRPTPDALVNMGNLVINREAAKRQADEAAYITGERKGVREAARDLNIPGWDTKPITLLQGIVDRSIKQQEAQKFFGSIPKPDQFGTQQIKVNSDGTTTVETTTASEFDKKEAQRQQQARETLLSKQLDYYNKKIDAEGALDKIRNSAKYVGFKIAVEGYDKEFDNLEKMKKGYVQEGTGVILNQHAYDVIIQRQAELADKMTSAINDIQEYSTKELGLPAEPGATTTTQKPNPFEAEAQQIGPMLNQFIQSGQKLPERPRTKGEDQDIYDKATKKYYELTDPALTYLKDQMRNNVFGRFSTPSPATVLYMNQRFGVDPTKAAIDRFYYAR